MIDVIIPVFNRPEYTKFTLDNLSSTDHGIEITPIIVDNGSRKKTKEIISTWAASFPNAIVVTSDQNKGFAAALNMGLSAKPSSEHVVIMHNDVIPFPGCFKEMHEVMVASEEDVAVVIPRTNYANEGSPCIPEVRKMFETFKPNNKDRLEPEALTALMEQIYPEGKEAFLKKLRDQAQMRTSFSPEISSFCMMVKSAMFNSYGKFDEDFWPRGYEDKFWFRAMERDGYVCMIANWCLASHFGNITSDGPGFSQPDVMKVNEDKYKAKCLEKDKAMGGRKAVAKT